MRVNSLMVGDIIKAPPHKHGNKGENIFNYGIVSHFKPSITHRHILNIVIAYQDEEGSVRDLQYMYQNDDDFKILKKGSRKIQEENNLFANIWNVGTDIVFYTDGDGWKKGTIIMASSSSGTVTVQAYDGNIKRKKRKKVMMVDKTTMKIARWVGCLDSLLDGAVEARIMGEEMEWEEELNAGVACSHSSNSSSNAEKDDDICSFEEE